MILTINFNSGLISSHSTIISTAEVVALVTTWLIKIYGIIKEIVLIIKVVCTIIISIYCKIVVIVILQDEFQTSQHTTVITECILLALDGLELTSIQIATTICIVPEILIVIVLTLIQVFSRNYLKPSLAYTSAIFNAVEVLPCFTILSIVALTLPSFADTCYRLVGRCCIMTYIVRSFLLVIRIQRPLSYHCTILIKCILLTVDGLILGSVSFVRFNHLTIGLEVEPTCLILIIVECSSGVLVVIVGCFIVCDIQL